MIPQQIKELLQDRLKVILHSHNASISYLAVGGGSINETYKVKVNNNTNFFLKLNSNLRFSKLFEKEKNGLEFLSKQNCFLAPYVILYETNGNYQLLLLEWIEPGTRNNDFWKKFGEQLAQLHHINNEHFGFYEDNYMGSLPQENTFAPTWIDFFINQRLEPQIRLAVDKHLLQKNHITSFEKLFKKLGSVFNVEKPSLLHGDLWSGNFMCNERSLPVLIDPAVYFGHRSIDLGMTTLFGGFDKVLYDSYNYHFPLPANHIDQWEVCNLYPLLIHLNLFGGGYLHEISGILKRFT
jgi:protein-ribulosamine 3-kinase